MSSISRVVAEFGPGEGLGDALRLPIFLSTLTEDATSAVKKAYQLLPSRVRAYIAEFDGALPEDVRNHPSYEFRVYLIPRMGPKTEADAAIEFFRVDDLSADELKKLNRMMVIVREKQVPARNLGRFKPSQVAERVKVAIPWIFHLGHHTQCWKHFKVRPAAGDAHPESTDGRYCEYDEVHADYVYTQAWVEKLIWELTPVEGFRAVTATDPLPKP